MSMFFFSWWPPSSLPQGSDSRLVWFDLAPFFTVTDRRSLVPLHFGLIWWLPSWPGLGLWSFHSTLTLTPTSQFIFISSFPPSYLLSRNFIPDFLPNFSPIMGKNTWFLISPIAYIPQQPSNCWFAFFEDRSSKFWVNSGCLVVLPLFYPRQTLRFHLSVLTLFPPVSEVVYFNRVWYDGLMVPIFLPRQFNLTVVWHRIRTWTTLY